MSAQARGRKPARASTAWQRHWPEMSSESPDDRTYTLSPICRCLRWPNPLQPGRVILAKKFTRCFGIPSVSVAPLCFDLRDLIPDDAIAPAEDRPVSFNLVEASPK